jgi:electron transfer flavoprotein alpha subunit
MTGKPVVVCAWNTRPGTLSVDAAGALAFGRRLARAMGAELHWLVPGPFPEGGEQTAARLGVDAIDHIEDAGTEPFSPDLVVAALAGYCREASPALVLFGQDAQARLVAPRLAGQLAAGVVMNVVDVAADPDGVLEATAAAYGGDTRVVYALTGAPSYVLGLAAHALGAEAAEEGEPTSPARRSLAPEPGAVSERVCVIERARAQGPRLEDAEIIVAGGRGLGSPECFALVEQLAKALGGSPAASRPLVDEGWVDASRQVGLTGSITRPALYLAAGISGASQHMAGCSAARTIVAINNDPDAAIFRYARYGVVGDCREILPELIRAVGR